MGKSGKRGDPPAPDAGVPKHDRSMWRGLVVSADEFAPGGRPPRRRLWLVLGAIAIAAAAGTVAFVALKGSGSPARVPDAAPLPPDAAIRPDAPVDAPPPPDAPVDAAPPVDAEVDASPPPDAAPAATPAKHPPPAKTPTKRRHGVHRK